MKLPYFSRTVGKKGENNRLRREGCIPAVLYGKELMQSIFIKKDEVAALLRSLNPDLLGTTLLELHDGQKTHKVLVKEVQYHRTSYAIEHIDFFLVSDDKTMHVNVPIQLVGVAECAGVKLGGFVRHVIRSLKISCLPKDLPKDFTLDVRDMEIGHAKRLADIPMPSGVRPMAKMEEVAVVVAKKV